MSTLWGKCLSCEDKYCCGDIAKPLFLTTEERERERASKTKYSTLLCLFQSKRIMRDSF